MPRDERPVTRLFGYKATVKDGEAAAEGVVGNPHTNDLMTSPRPQRPEKGTLESAPDLAKSTKPNRGGNDGAVSRRQSEQLARTLPK